MNHKCIQIFVLMMCWSSINSKRFVRNSGTQNACYTPLGDSGSCVSLKFCPQVVNLFTSLPQNRAKQYSKALQQICGNLMTYDNYPVVCCSKVVMGNNNNNNNFNNNHNPNNNPNNNNNNHNNNQQVPTTPIITPPLPETTTERDDRIIGITVPRVTPTQSTTTTTTTTSKPTPSVGNRCRSPDGEEGTCKALENCEHLLNRLRSNTNDETFKTYLRSSNSVCQSVGTNVCCASPSDRLVTPAPEIDIRRLPTEEEGCGFVNNKFNKVVGGEDSQIGAWPWMALIGYNAYSLAPFKCGGTLVSARHVITAAHCLRSDLSFVRLGEHDLSTETETQHVDIDVDKMLRHPRFNRDGRHDLAILYLVKNVEKTESILPICMPTSTHLRTKSYLRSNPFVAGWGRTMEGGTSSQVLQQLQIPVLDNSVCQESFKANGRVVSPNQFDESILCAGILVGGRDTCQGDSGGPLMIPELYKGITRYYLIGVVSYGIGCARVGVPGVYTSIQYTDHMDWITQRIAET